MKFATTTFSALLLAKTAFAGDLEARGWRYYSRLGQGQYRPAHTTTVHDVETIFVTETLHEQAQCTDAPPLQHVAPTQQPDYHDDYDLPEQQEVIHTVVVTETRNVEHTITREVEHVVTVTEAARPVHTETREVLPEQEDDHVTTTSHVRYQPDPTAHPVTNIEYTRPHIVTAPEEFSTYINTVVVTETSVEHVEATETATTVETLETTQTFSIDTTLLSFDTETFTQTQTLIVNTEQDQPQPTAPVEDPAQQPQQPPPEQTQQPPQEQPQQPPQQEQPQQPQQPPQEDPATLPPPNQETEIVENTETAVTEPETLAPTDTNTAPGGEETEVDTETNVEEDTETEAPTDTETAVGEQPTEVDTETENTETETFVDTDTEVPTNTDTATVEQPTEVDTETDVEEDTETEDVDTETATEVDTATETEVTESLPTETDATVIDTETAADPEETEFTDTEDPEETEFTDTQDPEETATGTDTAIPPAETEDGNGNGGDEDPQTSLTLDPRNIMTGLQSDGQEVPSPGQVPSLTSGNNFMNFCLNKGPLTDGLQIRTGSCNVVPMGRILARNRLPSCKFVFPENFGTIPANQPFTVQMKIKNLQTGAFTNAAKTYYGAPAQVNGDGILIGHSHIVIEPLPSLDHTEPLNPTVFTFFKGLNAPADGNGILSTLVDKGVPPGAYRMFSINTAANHQPALASIAQRGALDDGIYFTAV